MTSPIRVLFSVTAATAMVAGLSAGSVTAVPGAVRTTDESSITNLGEPVRKAQTLSSAIGEAPDGTPLGYYVVSGNPNVTAEFTVVNLRTEENVLQTRVPYGNSSQRTLGKSPVDGTIYFATSDVSHLYRYQPGDTEIEHLGPAPEGQRVWSMAVGADETVWFGTYPGGRLYSLDPESGDMTDHGQAIEGEQYIGSIYPDEDTVYVGTQPNARLAEYDRSSGDFTEIALPDDHSGSKITALDLRDDLLFVSTTDMHVMDVTTGEWVDRLSGANARVSPISPTDPDAVYLRLNGEITRYDLSTGELTGTGRSPNATPESWGWIDLDGTGPWLALTYWRQGRTYAWNLETGEGSYQVPDLMGAGAPLISLGTGPLGNIYAGAFLSPPGMGKYDPDREGFELLNGTSQVEGFGTFGEDLVFGRYPQGYLYRYDPSQPWDYRTNPPSPLRIGDDQNRTKAFVELDAVPGTVAIASVPTTGQHGGAITHWQPDEGTHQVYRDVVENQSPVSLVQHDGLLLGGTSIQGGYGVDPVTDEAVLFAWDPVSTETLWSEVPVSGASTVSGLAIDDDGHVWGIADSRTVFEFDLEARETIRTIDVDPDAGIDRYGDDNRLLFDEGRLFGSAASQLFVLDQITGEVTTLYGGDGGPRVQELARDRYGDLYIIGSSTRLLRYAMPDDTTAPEVSAEPASSNSRGTAVLWLHADDDTDDDPAIHYRIDDGDWTEYEGSRPVLVKRGETLEYRAIDDAWNSSSVQTFSQPS